MCKAMSDALNVFRRAQAKKNVLFILSDGKSGDGNPRDVAQELNRLGCDHSHMFPHRSSHR